LTRPPQRSGIGSVLAFDALVIESAGVGAIT
jgi:hypothetical protein